MAAASWVLSGDGPAADRTAMVNLLHLLIGFACICGHMFSIFLRFTGGKGVATSAGVALGLYPFFTLAGLATVVVWTIVFFVSRYVSLASMVAAARLPGGFYYDRPIQRPGTRLAGSFRYWSLRFWLPVLIVVRHRSQHFAPDRWDRE